MPAIELSDMSFGYQSGDLFQSVTALLAGNSDRGKVIAIMGPSGSGKSTLLRLLAGIESPRSGMITVIPKETAVSYLPQDAVVFEHLSRLENGRYFSMLRSQRGRFDEQVFLDNIAKLKNGS